MDERTVLAVLLLVFEPDGNPSLVERALRASLGEVRMRLGKQPPRLARVLVQAGLGTVAAQLAALGRGGGVFVGGFEGLAIVSAVSRAMMIPEEMVDGEDGVAP